ncbi:MAG: glycosyltransferase family 2 protein [Limnochordaceae bacterium]|nr:glycosyltransferase family 2 protein [Limnochordaceae bacterium]
MGNKLTAVMIAHNEADRYLGMVLEDLVSYCDEVVVLDSGSTDGTASLARSFPRVRVYRNERDLFWEDESALRQQAWELALATRPEWILAIDADEMLERKFKKMRFQLLSQKGYHLLGFQRFHMWNGMNTYRVDKGWDNRWVYTPMIARVFPGKTYRFRPQKLHGGRLPENVDGPMLATGLRYRDFGYVRKEDQVRKYHEYMAHDPTGCGGVLLDHYRSILDPNPVLLPWTE